MINYLSDSATGRIDEYPHIVRGTIDVFTDMGTICGASFSSGEELLTHNEKYIYKRHSYMSNRAVVCDINGNSVDEINVDDLDL